MNDDITTKPEERANLTESLAGVFWSPDTPNRSGKGELVVTGGNYVINMNPCVFIVPSHRVTKTETGVCIDHSAATIAKDHLPQVVWGKLADGEDISLIDAQMYLESNFLELPKVIFTGARLICGTHIRPLDPIIGVRWTLNLKNTPAWMGQDSVKTSSGLIASWSDTNNPGFSLEPDEPQPLRETADLWPQRVNNLLTLAMGDDVSVLTREVKIANGTWHTYGQPPSVQPISQGELLQPHNLDMSLVARWVNKSQHLGRYPAVAAQQMPAIEIAGQVYATSLEGLHRLLHAESSVFPGLSQRALKRARHAAVEAAATRLVDNEGWDDRQKAKDIYRNALSQVDKPDYSARLTQLLTPLFKLLPQIFGGDLTRWIDLSRRIRNDESHGLNGGSFLDESDYSRYIVLARSARWALRLLILREVVDEAVLLNSVGQSSAFWYLLANIDEEGVWPEYVCTDSFIEMNRQHTET